MHFEYKIQIKEERYCDVLQSLFSFTTIIVLMYILFLFYGRLAEHFIHNHQELGRIKKKKYQMTACQQIGRHNISNVLSMYVIMF